MEEKAPPLNCHIHVIACDKKLVDEKHFGDFLILFTEIEYYYTVIG